MADITWPAALPQEISRGLGLTLPDTIVRSTNDAGPANVRRRFSANVAPLTGSILIDAGQWQVLVDFYTGPAMGGARRFNWVDPVSGAPVEMRFVSPPKLSQVDGLLLEAALSLEIMP